MRKLITILLAIMLLLALCPVHAEDAAEEGTTGPAKAYVLVTAGNQTRWFPLPSEEDGEYTVNVRQNDPETGEEWLNVVAFTPNGVHMHEASCDNQDCVEMGEVTLENRSERVLGNIIVCLPHQVMLELYTPEEILAMYAGSEEAEQ